MKTHTMLDFQTHAKDARIPGYCNFASGKRKIAIAAVCHLKSLLGADELTPACYLLSLFVFYLKKIFLKKHSMIFYEVNVASLDLSLEERFRHVAEPCLRIMTK